MNMMHQMASDGPSDVQNILHIIPHSHLIWEFLLASALRLHSKRTYAYKYLKKENAFYDSVSVYVCTLDILFGQVSTVLKDSTAIVHGLGGL